MIVFEPRLYAFLSIALNSPKPVIWAWEGNWIKALCCSKHPFSRDEATDETVEK